MFCEERKKNLLGARGRERYGLAVAVLALAALAIAVGSPIICFNGLSDCSRCVGFCKEV